jgi:hypothetical protein
MTILSTSIGQRVTAHRQGGPPPGLLAGLALALLVAGLATSVAPGEVLPSPFADHVVFLGLLIAGIAVPGLLLGLLPRGVAVTGLRSSGRTTPSSGIAIAGPGAAHRRSGRAGGLLRGPTRGRGAGAGPEEYARVRATYGIVR